MSTNSFRMDNPTLKRSAEKLESLDGEWEYLVDPRIGEGQTEEFYSPAREFPGVIDVPGCWQGQTGVAAAQAFAFNYRSVAYYKKHFDLPASWDGERIWLCLGGVAPAADVWMNRHYLGFTNSSRSPLRFDVTACAALGGGNEVVVKVSRPRLRLDGTWDYPNGGWEGIYRSVKILATSAAWIEDVFVMPDGITGHVTVRTCLETQNAEPGIAHLTCEILSPTGVVCAGQELDVSLGRQGQLERDVALDVLDPRLWAPQHPALYTARLTLAQDGRAVDQVRVRFGIREICVEGNRLLLNGIPVYLRGFGWNIGYYPRTICPPASKDFYRQRIELARAYGFNYTKTEIEAVLPEMLEAADEAGLLVTFEMPFGMNAEHRDLRYDPPPEFANLWERELKRMVGWSRNYASVVNYSITSELDLERQTQASFDLFNRRLPRICRELAPSALVTDTTSGAGVTVDTSKGKRDTDICDQHYWRDVLDPPAPISSFYRSGGSSERPDDDELNWIDDVKLPFVFHEYLWWSQYPNVALVPKYDGHPMVPYWLTEAERIAERMGFTHLLRAFARNSEKVLAICRKEGIEFARKQPGASGFVMYMLLDMTWSVEGLLDDFGDPKEAVGPGDFYRSNADSVILLNENSRRCFWCGEEFDLDLWVSHYGEQPIDRGRLTWEISAGNEIVASDVRTVQMACGRVESVFRKSISLPISSVASEYVLHAELARADGKLINANAWSLWGFPRITGGCSSDPMIFTQGVPSGWAQRYPSHSELQPGAAVPSAADLVIIGSALTDEIREYLVGGGRVIAFSDGAFPEVRQRYCDLYRTIPWNTGNEGNSGTLVNKDHRALIGFPCGDYCDLQFVHLIKGAWPLDLDVWRPMVVEPIIRCIDHYRQGRHKAYLYEIGVGNGRLLVTSLNVANTFDEGHPETLSLVDGLIAYTSSDEFLPDAKIDISVFDRVLESRQESSVDACAAQL